MPINHLLARRFASALSTHAHMVLTGRSGENSAIYLSEMTLVIAMTDPDALDRFVLSFLQFFHTAKVQVDPGFGPFSEKKLKQIGDRHDG